MAVDKKFKNACIIAAAILLAGALVWSFVISGSDELSRIARMLNGYGFTTSAEDIYVYGDAADSSIAMICGADELSSMVEASRAAGFPCDVDAVGEVAVLLAAVDEDTVITLYVLDGEVELCFLQKLESGDILPINAYAAGGGEAGK